MNKPSTARKTGSAKASIAEPTKSSTKPPAKGSTPGPSPLVPEKPVLPAKPQATIETGFGVITVELWPDKAPRHVENFIKITEKGQYNNLIFHRVIPGFMIQTGCPKGDGTGGPGWKVPAEFNDARFVKGVLGMARGAHRDSAGSQFFICVADAPHLNGSYTAFGKVLSGLDVAERIAQVQKDRRDKPLEDVKMIKVTIRRA